MNALEKILDKIEERMNMVENIPVDEDDGFLDGEECYEAGRVQGRYEELVWCRNMIRSHMDEVQNCGDCSRRKWYQKGYEDGKKDNGWIPVSDKLPEAGDGKYYPLLNVQTSYGAVKCGFYRVRDDRWYIYEEFYNEFIEANKKEVVAWQPFPEPYKEE